MKELHNHIFSNTTCISKETMLKYINHQLSEKELHEVEKHMLDCELCSDALEGIRYAENSSMLFAIDNQIDQRVRVGQTKSPIMRNLMVAASLLILIVGGYTVVNFFDKTANEAELAITNEENPISELDKTTLKPNEEKLAEPLTDNTIASGENIDANNQVQAPAAPEIIEVAEAEESEEVAFDDVVVLEDEVLEEHNEAEVVVNFDRVQEQRNNSTENSLAMGAVTTSGNAQQEIDNDGLNKRLDNNNSNKKDKAKDERKAKTKKGAFKNRAKASAPAYKSNVDMMDAEMVEEESGKSYRTTITLSDHKVVNYIDEYQRAYELNQIVETKTESVSAGYASEEDMKKAEKEREEEKVEITYKATLEKAMAYYKAKNYTMTLSEFNVILKKHPKEVNALFYGGLSYYHLNKNNEALNKFNKVLNNKKTEFNQEAKWYKALTLIELKQIDNAKKQLQQIIAANGFYKTKAEAKLKEIE